jgi:biotin synthase-related radical SAM superfamily protein
MIRVGLSQGREVICSLTPTEGVTTVSVGETPIHKPQPQSMWAALLDNGKITRFSSSPVQEKAISNRTKLPVTAEGV